MASYKNYKSSQLDKIKAAGLLIRLPGQSCRFPSHYLKPDTLLCIPKYELKQYNIGSTDISAYSTKQPKNQIMRKQRTMEEKQFNHKEKVMKVLTIFWTF